MWPPTHPAVGYLAYSLLARTRHGRAPEAGPAAAVLVGGALPDVVDLPLRWAGVVPDVRLFGHTLVTAIPLAALALWLARRRGRPALGVAFAVGLGGHVAADALWPVLYGDAHELGFLLWPITESRPYESVKPIGAVGAIEVTTRTVEYVLLLSGIVAWIGDGTPGLGRRERASENGTRR